MGMPQDLVLVRHGESEFNYVQRAEKRGEVVEYADLIYGRHDFEQRLTPQGVEEAKAARFWLQENFISPEDFDERYVSPFYRTLETAAHLGGVACTWLPAVSLIERSWGVYGATPLEERKVKFAATERLKELSSFFTSLDGGDSNLDAVYQFRDWVNTLDRDKGGSSRVIGVSHGEKMWAARFVIERMMPHEWQDLDNDKSLRIGNCNLLWYSKVNPEDPQDIRESLADGWRRMVNPTQPELSPYGGEWQKLPGKRRFDAAQLLGIVATKPRLLTDEQSNQESA
jgi:broad specificity phosphatase PhoE